MDSQTFQYISRGEWNLVAGAEGSASMEFAGGITRLGCRVATQSAWHSLPARFATRMEILLFTTLTVAQAAVNEIRSLGKKELKVRGLQEYYVAGGLV